MPRRTIGELLSGTGHTTYVVELAGITDGARRRVAGLPWVVSVEENPAKDTVSWHVAVADDEAADASLLRTIMADESVKVRQFGRRRYQLEDVFMNLIEGGNGR